MGQVPNYSEVITRAASHYWGEPNKRLSQTNVLRFGNHGSKAVNIEKATWFDHEENIGGGIVDLIRHQEPGASVPDRLAEFGLPKAFPTRRKETVWNYTNSEGEIIYQVVRIDDAASKTYRQRQLTPDGKQVWNMLGVTPLPYRLPELIKSSGTVFIVEGEKCADALAALGLTATTNHGGAGKWWSVLTAYFQERDVVIIPDNDDAGRNHAAKIAAALNGVANSIKILPLPTLRNKGDIYDWLIDGGQKEELYELIENAAFYDLNENYLIPEYSTNSYDIINDTKINASNLLELFAWGELNERSVDWLIQDLIPAHGFVALYGKPGSFKSFVALYIAVMIGAGNSAFNRPCKSATVVYIAGEGGAGLKSRCDALEKNYGIDTAKVFFIPQQLNLRSTDIDREKLVATIRERGIEPSLVIIDTLARAFAGGNENASDDMGAFIRQIGKVQQDLNTAVLIVHHSGKDEARGQRGHSSLLGAIDTELEVIKIPSGSKDERIGQITVTKQKDGEDGLRIGYRMEVVSLGLVDANKTSLVVVPTEPNYLSDKAKNKELNGQAKLALDALHEALGKDGKVTNLSNIPPNTQSVEEKYWRHTFYAKRTGELDTKRKAFDRAAQFLQQGEYIGVWDGLVWIIKN